MKTVIDILIALARILLPALIKASGDTSEDASPQTELRDKLRRRVRETWGKAMVLLMCLLFLTGCATRTLYVPDGTPVRLRETLRDAKVWVLDQDGRPVPGVADLMEGWYVLPPEPESGR